MGSGGRCGLVEPVRGDESGGGDADDAPHLDCGTGLVAHCERCSTFPTLRGAGAALSQIKADRSRGTLVRPSRVTFEELCVRWLASRHDVREVSQQGYVYALRLAREKLGRTRVQVFAR